MQSLSNLFKILCADLGMVFQQEGECVANFALGLVVAWAAKA